VGSENEEGLRRRASGRSRSSESKRELRDLFFLMHEPKMFLKPKSLCVYNFCVYLRGQQFLRPYSYK
jgi:hypothetical protein